MSSIFPVSGSETEQGGPAILTFEPQNAEITCGAGNKYSFHAPAPFRVRGLADCHDAWFN